MEGVDLTGVVNQITPIYFDKIIQNKNIELARTRANIVGLNVILNVFRHIAK